MEARTNKINRSTINMDVSPREMAEEIQDRISVTFNGRLKEEIDLLFTKYSLQDKITSIDRLELDIGQLSAKYLEEEFTEKVIRALEEKLQAYRVQYSLKEEDEKKDDHGQELEHLKHFLSYGYLPWQVSYQTDFHQLVARVIATQAFALIAFLKNTGANRYVRQRVAWQFSEPSVVGVIQTLVPGHAATILSYVKELDQHQQEEKLVQAPASDFKKALYEFVLHYLLAEKGVDFNARMFTRSVLKQIAAHYNITYPALLFHLGEALALYDKASTKGSLLEVIEQIYTEDISGIAVLNAFSKTSLASGPGNEMVKRLGWASLFNFLQKGYFPSPAYTWSRAETFVLFEQLLKKSPATFERFFRSQHGPGIVDRLTGFFPVQLVQLVTNILVGREQAWAHDLGKNLVKLNARHHLINTSEKEILQVANRAVLQAAMLNNKTLDQEKVLRQLLVVVSDGLNKNFQEVATALLSLFPEMDNNGRKYEWLSSMEHGQTLMEKTNQLLEPGKEERQAVVNYFLLKGKMPWWSPATSETKIKQWFVESIASTSNSGTLDFIKIHINDVSLRKNILSLSSGPELTRIFSAVRGSENTLRETEWRKISQQLSRKDFDLFREVYLLHAFWAKEKEYLLGAELGRTFQRYGVHQPLFRDNMIKLGKNIPGLFYGSFMTEVLLLENEAKIETKEESPVISEKRKKQPLQKDKKEKAGNEPKEEKKSNSFSKTEEDPFLEHDKAWEKEHEQEKRLRAEHEKENREEGLENEKAIETDTGKSKITKETQAKKQPIVDSKPPETITSPNKLKEETQEDNFYSGREKVKLPADAELYLNAFNEFVLTGNMPYYFSGTFQDLLQALEPYKNYFNGNLLYAYALSSLKDESMRKHFLKYFDRPEAFAAFLRLFFHRQYQFLNKYLQEWRRLFSHAAIGPVYGLDEITVLEHAFTFLLKNGTRSFGAAAFMKYFIGALNLQPEMRQPLFRKAVELAREQEIMIPSILSYLLIETREKKPEPVKEREQEEVAVISEEGIFIENAGAVILWPFLIHYYQQLGLLNEERKFKDEKSAYRAVHLLQYLVTGQEDHPEYKLVLNKILCGIQQNKPVDQASALTEEEKKLSESLLKAVINQWEIIRNSSVETLREYFLIRNGKIESNGEKTSLVVEQKSIDMLVTKIPWGMSMIKLPWMNEPLYVKWK